MTTKQVVIAFLILYLLLMGVGGAMYYSIKNPPKPQTNVETEKETSEVAENTENAENSADAKVAEDTEVKQKQRLAEATKRAIEKEKELQAKKIKEQEEQKKRDAEMAKEREEAQNVEKLKADLEGRMKVIERGSTTFYTHERGKELSGVHLRPFIVERNGIVILKHDIYYYSSLDDSNYGWIHGSHLDVTADGVQYSYELDPSARRDKLGKGAEDLTENYVMDARKDVIEMLKTVGNASNVTLHYWGDSDIVCTLSRADIRRIHEMVTFYEILEKEANGDL